MSSWYYNIIRSSSLLVNHGNLRVKKVEITLFGHYKMSVVISIKTSKSICFYLLRGSFCVKLWVTANSLHSKLLPSFSSPFILNLSIFFFSFHQATRASCWHWVCHGLLLFQQCGCCCKNSSTKMECAEVFIEKELGNGLLN